MQQPMRTGEPAAQVELPTLLDLRAAKPLADRLLALRGSPVTVDASKVEKVGGQCVQVLVSAAKTWEADGAGLALLAPSEAFLSSLRLLGLTPDQLSTTDLSA